MTKVSTNIVHKLHGTYEIDETGKITYFFSAYESGEINRQMIGKNFYDYLQDVLSNNELQTKIKTFIAGSASTDSFNCNYVLEGSRQKCLVLLARVREKSFDKQDLIVIDIKPEQKF